MKCYRVNIVGYVYAESEEEAETVLQNMGLIGNECYSYHEIEEDEDRIEDSE